MSKIIAANVIAGAHKVYEKARKKYEMAVQKYGKKKEISFPNTGYYIPIIYSMTGIAVEKLSDFEQVFAQINDLLPPEVDEEVLQRLRTV